MTTNLHSEAFSTFNQTHEEADGYTFNGLIDEERPPEVTLPSGDSITYDRLCAAWQSDNKDAYIVWKSNMIDDSLPIDWCVIHVDGRTGDFEQLEVTTISTLPREGGPTINLLMLDTPQNGHHGTYNLEFGVNEMYIPKSPLTVLRGRTREVYDQAIEGVEYAKPVALNPEEHPIFTDPELLEIADKLYEELGSRAVDNT